MATGAFTAEQAAARPEHLAATSTPAAAAPAASTGPSEAGDPAPPKPGNAEQIAEGRRLYLTGCSSCHGVDGKGVTTPKGRLQGPSLIDVGEAAAYYMLSTGRMPLASSDQQPTNKPSAYKPDQTAALVAYVASLGPGPSVPKLDLANANIADGGELFRANCAPCHNASGSGGALSYGRHAPALTNVPPLVVGAAVRYGPGQMPRFAPGTLSDKQVADIATYVKYLHHPRDRGGLSLGRLGPVPEGFAIWVLGLGTLLAIALWISKRVKSYR